MTPLLAMLLLADTSTTERPRTRPYHNPIPSPDLRAQVYVESRPRELHACSVTALVDRFGVLTDVVVGECPDDLAATSSAAVRGWKFHPAVHQDLAVPGQYEVTFVYVASLVKTTVPLPQKTRLVRLEPMARLDWPSPPRVTREMKQYMAEHWLTELTCVADLQVSKRGTPENVQWVDCPEPFATETFKRMERYGLTPIGAEAGDGRVYRMWLRFSAE